MPECGEQRTEGALVESTLGPSLETILPSERSGPVMGEAALKISEMPSGLFFHCLDEDHLASFYLTRVSLSHGCLDKLLVFFLEHNFYLQSD